MIRLMIIIGMLLSFGYNTSCYINPLLKVKQLDSVDLFNPTLIDVNEVDDDEGTQFQSNLVLFNFLFNEAEIEEHYIEFVDSRYLEVNEKDRHDAMYYNLIRQINLDMTI